MVNRRGFMRGLAASIGLAVIAGGTAAMSFGTSKDASFPFQLTDAQWRARLTAEQYRVLRGHGTEQSRSSPLDHEKREGIFHCAGCDHPLFSSAHKFDSGTGWPSFWQPLNEKAVGESVDYKLLYPRTEIHCANCGGHLGHVFNDGPPPTGKRYCMNGVAMVFKVGSREM